MRSVQVFEAKAHFSSLLAEVEAGEEIWITRHGRVVARLVPQRPLTASDVFAPCWAQAEEIDLVAPSDPPPEPLAAL